MRYLIVALAACSAGAPGPGIAVDRAMAHVDALAGEIGPRVGDTDPARAAAAYIAREVPGIERFDVGGVDLPDIAVLGYSWRPGRHVDTTDPDLLARFGPPGRELVITAHYDTVPGSPGAVDNAAAVAVLIELARVWREHPPAQPVLLVFSANEEIGLVGAEALAERHGDEVAFAIALDLIGGSGPLVLNGASTLIRAPELRWIADAADRAGVVVRAPLPHRVVSRWWPQIERADHGAFTRRGIRAVHFYNRGQDGDWIDLAYHSPADVPSRVHRDALDETGRLLRALAESPPPEPGGDDGFWLPLAANTIVPRWLLVAVDVALAAVALAGLALFARSRPRRGRGAGFFAALVCYAAAVAATIAVERAFAGDHPAPWLHDPLRAELAEALVLAGATGLLGRLVARRWPWKGERRFLAVAIVLPLVLGAFWLAVGAAELAWIWLVPAALAAVAPRLGRAAPLALVASVLPAALVLLPAQLREAAWNGFLPVSLPLAAWLALFLASPLGVAVWWSRRTASGPLGTLVLALGCGLAVAAGLGLLATDRPACTAQQFQHLHLACELPGTWR
ncbi:MAG TPA: M20/M25/M40 family metallo-hydrolase [Kofleriaceae bacterium]|nr:M20/M25/M40 family metallo-hydrolase [Kofleriaceae bacterium]